MAFDLDADEILHGVQLPRRGIVGGDHEARGAGALLLGIGNLARLAQSGERLELGLKRIASEIAVGRPAVGAAAAGDDGLGASLCCALVG